MLQHLASAGQITKQGKEAELQRYSLPIAATESGASWLAERAPMMPIGMCMCRATWCQPRTAADGAPQENPVSNRGPSIRHGKKDIVSERGLLKTAFPLRLYLLHIIMVLSDWGFAPKCVCGPNSKSYLIGESQF